MSLLSKYTFPDISVQTTNREVIKTRIIPKICYGFYGFDENIGPNNNVFRYTKLRICLNARTCELVYIYIYVIEIPDDTR
jgi:hypothetical protein